MRRAAIQAFRTARRAPLRKLAGHRGFPLLLTHDLNRRSSSTSKGQSSNSTSAKSMYFRNFSLALVSSLGGLGAWYAYRGTPSTAAGFRGNGANTISGGPAQQSRAITSSSVYSDAPLAPSSPVNPQEAAESTRRALVVENDQFYTGSIVGDGPLQKETDDAGRKILEMLTPEQATQKLRRNEESFLVARGQGVVRYDVVQIPSNDPIEDDHSEKIVPQNLTGGKEESLTSSDWMFWGVYDGHRYLEWILSASDSLIPYSGWTTSAKLRQVLISFVARELAAAYKSSSTSLPTPASIDSAIKNGFLRLDNEIIHESVTKVLKANSKRVAAELLAPALSGSCALLSFYDSRSRLLRVACTGDSRAVLGRRTPSGKWSATALSVDQTGGNEAEAARLRAEHPGEPNVVRNGRVLGGLEPSRAFGDSFYKWTRETQDKIKMSFFGRTPSNQLLSPPYVTAEPIITTTRVEPEKGDFVVMATDGLWEMLTNEEVVGLVGSWMEKQAKGLSTASSSSPSSSSSWLRSLFGSSSSLPVEKSSSDAADKQGGQRAPIRQLQWGVDGKEEQRFVVEDKNAATHLVRNALGGRDTDMVCALLTLPSPYSRRYRYVSFLFRSLHQSSLHATMLTDLLNHRDDLTVEVIFFGDENASNATGQVVVNQDASASANSNTNAGAGAGGDQQIVKAKL
jgi:pyruvate dehydrogenase phosphatase